MKKVFRIEAGDYNKEVTLTLSVAELKAIHNLLNDVDKNMVGYKRNQEYIVGVLKDINKKRGL
jgi:hypothetical protein